MKERTMVATLVTVLAVLPLFVSRNTDAVYVAVSIAFFALCIAYAEGCEKL